MRALPPRYPQDHVAVALARSRHGPQTVEDGRFDVDEADGLRVVLRHAVAVAAAAADVIETPAVAVAE